LPFVWFLAKKLLEVIRLKTDKTDLTD
jgi:hypothetical protein